MRTNRARMRQKNRGKRLRRKVTTVQNAHPGWGRPCRTGPTGKQPGEEMPIVYEHPLRRDALFDEHHLPCDGAGRRLELVHVHPAREVVPVEGHPVRRRRQYAVDEGGDHATRHIVDADPHVLRLVDRVLERGRRIEWIRVVLVQLDLGRQLTRDLLDGHRERRVLLERQRTRCDLECALWQGVFGRPGSTFVRTYVVRAVAPRSGPGTKALVLCEGCPLPVHIAECDRTVRRTYHSQRAFIDIIVIVIRENETIDQEGEIALVATLRDALRKGPDRIAYADGHRVPGFRIEGLCFVVVGGRHVDGEVHVDAGTLGDHVCRRNVVEIRNSDILLRLSGELRRPVDSGCVTFLPPARRVDPIDIPEGLVVEVAEVFIGYRLTRHQRERDGGLETRCTRLTLHEALIRIDVGAVLPSIEAAEDPECIATRNVEKTDFLERREVDREDDQ